MNRSLTWLYDAVWIVTMPVWLTWYTCFKRRGHPGIRQRFGRYPQSKREALASGDRPIWLHAVSVGELLAALPLISALSAQYPKRRWVVSTTTPTGQKLARERLPQSIPVFYAPWDMTFCVRRALDTIRPQMFIGMETELWPNLFRHLKAAGVAVAVVNGRISDKSFPRYRRFVAWMSPLLRSVDFWGMQTLRDAQRITEIGADSARVHVTGNLKADIAIPDWNEERRRAQRNGFGLDSKSALWIAGSTHPGEEKIVVSAFRQVQLDHPAIRLMVAPRHPERITDIERIVRQAGLVPLRRSGMMHAPVETWQERTVVLIDTLGELSDLYALADFAFVGGSLIPRGGHNLLEPAQWAKPILTGPHTQNFQSILELLKTNDAVRVAGSAEGLAAEVRRWLADPAAARALGERACAAVKAQAGSTRKTVDLMTRTFGTIFNAP